ncbi:peptide/nickel transport system ATP-binding protein [Candidatus Pantoea symbiotica]|jgi:peptide/nickel transport system ATP-binding protein|uniref:Peptide/nickel transport system ATP-binding protein n=1 Tax=Candidatus Pantoea symbiotica TaxID=1884370 RepID=A0A1I3Q6U6_9GAMM|nr:MULTISPECIES: ABC transporter ATP-binding protein [Pantoea]KAJ9433144.1 ABC transporter ATP-binding protein [Pantoea sp. YR343]MRT26754.1 dipeptide ABC transporter ATP-binding protein [Enterobacteriaceae bacterium RIT697]SFJ29312.1 peptide/nickel transport system ATP-binding protein [Pantoea symbiotica]SFU29729.1 peptide/nickel transport system ATP-binding protein [Pantoea sp. YR525]
MTNTRLLSVENLSLHTHDQRLLVDNVSFDLGRKEILALVGESGSGKTLTSLALMSLLPPGVQQSGGRVVFNGEPLDACKTQQLRGCRIATVFQEPMTSMNPTLRIGEQIAEVLVRHRQFSWKQAQQEAIALLERVGIVNPAQRARQYIHQLSGGMRQRVMIASAISGQPELLIADEPTTALDVTIQAQILALLQELQQEMGMGILLITHDLSVVARYADRVCVMQQGRLVEQGAVLSTLGAPTHPYTRKLIAASATQIPEAIVPVEQPPLLVLRDISKSYPLPRRMPLWPAKRQTVLHPANLSIAQGEIVGLIGESGSGKTTLGSAAIGLITADGGEVHFQGQHLQGRQLNTLRRHAQIIFQDPYASLNPKIPVGEQIAEPLRVWQLRKGAAVDQRVKELLALVGLKAEHAGRLPGAFSGGQRQRIAIARALAMEPKLLVADEAVAALDLSVRGQILALFNDLRHKLGLSVLFISHDLSAVRQLCDRVVVMYHGRIVESGATASVINHPQDNYTRQLLAAAPDVQQALALRSAAV